ncbi:MAG TPA: aldehyde dehydrogenase family protein [Thermoanaerobaculia bacterium]
MAVLLQRPSFPLDFAREAAAARESQADWSARPLPERLWILRSIRHRLSEKAGELARTVAGQTGRSEAEVLSSEILPLADACRFLEREAQGLLATRRFGPEGRPAWMGKVDFEVRREPLGLVLILAPSNYPLFLPAVQAMQAITAGNGVLWKPGRGGFAAARAFLDVAALAGLDWQLIQVLPDTIEAGSAALAAGPDKVLLTGSAATGREVLAEAGRRLVPTTAELSGCDALFVLPGADLERTAKAIRFGLTLNGGNTCIAPRRVFVPKELYPELKRRVGELTDISFTAVGDVEEALAAAARSPYALGASIFGPEEDALALAARVRAGVVTINDLIVPTADPRLPFGGRGESGYGVTRGAEGLLDLTAIKVVSVRQGRWLPHLEERQPGDGELFQAWLAAAHGDGLKARAGGAARLVKALIQRGRS